MLRPVTVTRHQAFDLKRGKRRFVIFIRADKTLDFYPVFVFGPKLLFAPADVIGNNGIGEIQNFLR